MGAIVFPDMSNESYHSDIKSISRSAIMEFIRSPANYWHAYHNPERPVKEETDAMKLGSAFHALLLEPKLFEERYAVLPENIDRRTKQGKEDYEAFLNVSMGKTVLKKDQMEMINSMAKSVSNNPTVHNLIQDAYYEHSIFWDDERTGLRLKTRPDIWHANMTVDLKTILSADPRMFQNAMASHGYHLQAALNREGIRAVTGDDVKKHVFICVEKTFPFLSAVYILDESALDTAHNILRRVLSEMKACTESNNWPGYDSQIIGLPNWAMTA